jgi:hypothetical protein
MAQRCKVPPLYGRAQKQNTSESRQSIEGSAGFFSEAVLFSFKAPENLYTKITLRSKRG